MERRRLRLLDAATPSRPGRPAPPQCAGKATADVSAVADPNTGVAVYDSYAYQGARGWMVVRRHQRLLADHRRRLRAWAGGQPASYPAALHLGARRRRSTTSRPAATAPARTAGVVPRRHRLGRPDRPRHAERHQRLLTGPTSAARRPPGTAGRRASRAGTSSRRPRLPSKYCAGRRGRRARRARRGRTASSTSAASARRSGRSTATASRPSRPVRVRAHSTSRGPSTGWAR